MFIEKGADIVDGFWRVSERFMYPLVCPGFVHRVKPEIYENTIRERLFFGLPFPFFGNDSFSSRSVRLGKYALTLQNIADSRVASDIPDRGSRSGARYIIQVDGVQPRQIFLHRVWSHKWEEGINTILRVVIGEGAEEQSSQSTSKSKSIRVPLTVGEAPGSQIVRCIVLSEVSISTGERNSVAENCSTNREACQGY